jgi:hypothetical protein
MSRNGTVETGNEDIARSVPAEFHVVTRASIITAIISARHGSCEPLRMRSPTPAAFRDHASAPHDRDRMLLAVSPRQILCLRIATRTIWHHVNDALNDGSGGRIGRGRIGRDRVGWREWRLVRRDLAATRCVIIWIVPGSAEPSSLPPVSESPMSRERRPKCVRAHAGLVDEWRSPRMDEWSSGRGTECGGGPPAGSRPPRRRVWQRSRAPGEWRRLRA